MWIWFANIHNDLHSQKNPLISNIHLSFTPKAVRKNAREVNIISEMEEIWINPQLNQLSTGGSVSTTL